MAVNSLSAETLVLDRDDLPEVGCDASNVERVFKPAADRYLVLLDPPMDRSRGGILVPDVSVPQSRSGIVIRVGPGAQSDDGKTKIPMHAREGERVLFEYAAGYSIPRVPDATTTRERGYRVIRDGSIIAVIDGSGAWPEFADDADKIVPRLRMLQDWLLVRNDRPQAIHRLAMPSRALTPAEKAGKRVRANGSGPVSVKLPPAARGRFLVLPSAGSQVQLAERWTGTVVARGPGALAITRCLDGDRMGKFPCGCRLGDRVLYTTAFPLMSLPGVDGHAIVREGPCLEGVLGA